MEKKGELKIEEDPVPNKHSSAIKASEKYSYRPRTSHARGTDQFKTLEIGSIISRTMNRDERDTVRIGSKNENYVNCKSPLTISSINSPKHNRHKNLISPLNRTLEIPVTGGAYKRDLSICTNIETPLSFAGDISEFRKLNETQQHIYLDDGSRCSTRNKGINISFDNTLSAVKRDILKNSAAGKKYGKKQNVLPDWVR
jgi:hypothetical protein